MSPALIEKLKSRGRQKEAMLYGVGVEPTPQLPPESNTLDRVFLEYNISEKREEQRDKIDLGFGLPKTNSTSDRKPSLFSQSTNSISMRKDEKRDKIDLGFGFPKTIAANTQTPFSDKKPSLFSQSVKGQSGIPAMPRSDVVAVKNLDAPTQERLRKKTRM